MRFKNTSEVRIIPSIYILIVAAFVTNIFVNVEVMNSDTTNPMKFSHFLPNILLLLFGIYFHRIAQSFDFDSDGETLNLKNNGVFFSKFMEYRVKRAEFPKSKLINFKVSDYGIFSSLKVSITSRRKKAQEHIASILLFRKEEKKGMIESLDKILKKIKQSLNGFR